MVVTINADILSTLAWCCYLGEFGTTGCRTTGLAMRAPFAGLELDPTDFKSQHAIKCEDDHIKYQIRTCKRTLRHFVALVGLVLSTSEAGWRWTTEIIFNHGIADWRRIVIQWWWWRSSPPWRAWVGRERRLRDVWNCSLRAQPAEKGHSLWVNGHWSNSCQM